MDFVVKINNKKEKTEGQPESLKVFDRPIDLMIFG